MSNPVNVQMDKIGKLVDRELPIGWFFVVLAGAFGKDSRTVYVSNASRPDVIRLMYEFIETTKERYGEHIADLGAAAEDEQIGRLRQRVAELEREVEVLKTK